MYRDDADAGIHGAAEWLLRQWKQQGKIRVIDQELAAAMVDNRLDEPALARPGSTDYAASPPAKAGITKQWFINGQGHTMVILTVPVDPAIRSPKEKKDSQTNQTQPRKSIAQNFAIASKEVTVAQFHQFMPNFRSPIQYHASLDPDLPIQGINWYLAAAYCNWLSEKEGLAKDQWCYEPNVLGQFDEGMKQAADWSQRTGYRLPSNDEWTFACEAGATSYYYYGWTKVLLGKYACNSATTKAEWTFPVASLKPNDFGLFDMLGNVSEWCRDPLYAARVTDADKDGAAGETVTGQSRGVLRGGGFADPIHLLASFWFLFDYPAFDSPNVGFRVARTYSTAKLTNGANGPETLAHTRQTAVENAVLTSPRQGQAALLFSVWSNDQTARAANSATLDLAGPLTIEAWIRPVGNSPKGVQPIVSKKIDKTGYCLVLSTNSPPTLRFESGETALSAELRGKIERWIHVTAVQEQDAMKLYVNGELKSAIRSAVPRRKNNHPLWVGSGPFRDGWYGAIDEVRIWSVARSEAEIRGAIHRHLTGKESGLAAYWDFDEPGGNSVPDLTGHGNILTLSPGTHPGSMWCEGVPLSRADATAPVARSNLVPDGPWKLPPGAPPPAVAPFDAKKAKEHQAAWARQLRIPVATTNSIGMTLVLIPPGEFGMGSPKELIEEELKAHADNPWWKYHLLCEGPQHRVRITKPFCLGATKVTQGEYDRVMGENPSEFSPMGQAKDKVAGQSTKRFPVENVSWEDAAEFCRRLSAMPSEQSAGRTYRLPSNAQWEYACRAGSTGRFCFSSAGSGLSREDEEKRLSDYAWFDGNADGKTHPVGEKRANSWGLYDMHGNVWEWCQDWYADDYYGKSVTDDPEGPAGGGEHIVCGGGWGNAAYVCRSAGRSWGLRGGHDLGFRVSCTLSSTGNDSSKPIVFKGHEGACHAFVFSPNGKQMASGGADRVIRLWNLEDRKEILQLKGHSGEVYPAAFSADGRRLLSCSRDKTIRLWDLGTGKELVRLDGPVGVLCAMFLPGEQRLLAAYGDAEIRLWDLQRRRVIRSFHCPQKITFSMAMLPDEHRFLSACFLGKVLCLWDLETEKPIQIFPESGGCMPAVAVTANGHRAVSGSYDRTLRLWNVDTGEEIKHLNGHTSQIWCVAISEDGRYAASGASNYEKTASGGKHVRDAVRLWDLSHGQQIASYHFPVANEAWVRCVRFSPDNRYLYGSSDDGMICRWPLPGTIANHAKESRTAESTLPVVAAAINKPSLVITSSDSQSLVRLPSIGSFLGPDGKWKLRSGALAACRRTVRCQESQGTPGGVGETSRRAGRNHRFDRHEGGSDSALRVRDGLTQGTERRGIEDRE